MADAETKPIPSLPDAFAVRLLGAKAFAPPSRLIDGTRHTSAVCAELLQLAVSIHALGDGFVLFDFSKNIDLMGGAVDVNSQKANLYFSAESLARYRIVRGRTRVMNAFLLCLYQGAQPAYPGAVQASANAENYMTGAKHPDYTWELEGPSTSAGTLTCPVEVITKTTEILSTIIQHYGDKIIEALALLQVATVEYRVQNFDGALALGWFVIEFLLTVIWRKHHPTGKRPNAAPMSKKLLAEGHLAQDMSDRLDAVRDKRNNLVHELRPVEPENASATLTLAASFIALAIGSEFRLSLTYSWRG